jgi:hypothetical protein
LYDVFVRVLWLAPLAACGRIAFDPLPARDAAADGPCVWSTWSAPVRLGGAVNSTSDDWVPTPARDGLDLYFFSYRAGAQKTGIWHAQRPSLDVDFGAATLVAELDSVDDDRTIGVTDDALAAVFERNVGGTGSQLFATSRVALSDPFDPGTALAALNNFANSDPVLSADGLRLVFESSRGGTGAQDLYEATRTSRTSAFGPPLELTTVNSASNEIGPGLSSDGLEIVFASDRPGGKGGFDVYTSRRLALDQPFASPTPIDPLNGAMDDVGPRLSSDGATLYFNYNTITAGGGDADMWTATRSCL